MVKPSQKSRRIKLLIYAVTNSWLTLWYPRHFFHSFCGTFAACIDREGLVLFLRFWEIDVGEQQKYEKIIQEFVDNTGNDLHHEIVSKLKISKTFLFFFFFLYYIFILVKVFLRFLRIQFPLQFLPRQILQNIDMPRQKSRYL